MDEKYARLAQAVRALSSAAEVVTCGTSDREDWWVCTVRVGGVILVESAAGPLDQVLEEAVRKIKSISQKMQAILEAPEADSHSE